MRLLIGAYTQPMAWAEGKAEGIYLCELLTDTGRLDHRSIVKGPRNPTYIVSWPSIQRFYCVQETRESDDPRVFAFAIDDDKIHSLGSVAARGGLPCHLSLKAASRQVFVSNYETGTLVCFELDGDGRLIDSPAVICHQGSGPNPIHQTGPRVHSALPDASGKYLIVCDLGNDSITSYDLTVPRGVGSALAVVRFHSGAGPRNLELAPDRNRVFVVYELSSAIGSYDCMDGALTELDYVPTLPADWLGQELSNRAALNTDLSKHPFLKKWGALAATVVVHPNGQFLYVSNRGHDSIAAFKIESTGKLRPLGWEPSGGRTPRHIAIDPSGRFLLAANQDSNWVSVFSINPHDGTLTSTGNGLQVPSPACLAFH